MEHIDINKDNFKNINIDIDMAIFENINISINIDDGILLNIDIDEITYRLEFGISNTPIQKRPTIWNIPLPFPANLFGPN